MPLYEYRCEACGKTFEVIQKFSDEPIKVHEGCGGQVERLISPPALQFKGSGWYITDYAKKGGSSPNGKNGNAETASPAKSEPKPEANKTAKPAPASSGK